MNETPELNERLNKIFKDPVVQSKIVDQLVSDKPVGWSKRSNATYYKERYGQELKAVVDQMMVDKTDVYFPYKEFEEKFHINRDTLYIRINQSIRYLTERLDPEHKYAAFLETVEVTRERNKGVFIRFIPGLGGTESQLKPHPVVPPSANPKWRQRMEDFLENGDTGEQFFEDKLALSPEEITEIRISISQLPHVISNITAHTIKLIKINPEV